MLRRLDAAGRQFSSTRACQCALLSSTQLLTTTIPTLDMSVPSSTSVTESAVIAAVGWNGSFWTDASPVRALRPLSPHASDHPRTYLLQRHPPLVPIRPRCSELT